MSKKLIVTAFVVCFCVPLSGARAQTKSQKPSRPNLSGVWAVDPTKQEKTGFPEPSDMTLVISQHEPEIRMRRKFSLGGTKQEQELVYYTDHRGEVNPTLRGGKTKSESRTRWEGNRMVITYDTYSAQIAGSAVEARTEVDWRILKGGEVLIERITTSHRPGTSVDSTISTRDLRTPTIVPPTIIFERAYRKVH
jgi:hypothetical protein